MFHLAWIFENSFLNSLLVIHFLIIIDYVMCHNAHTITTEISKANNGVLDMVRTAKKRRAVNKKYYLSNRETLLTRQKERYSDLKKASGRPSSR